MVMCRMRSLGLHPLHRRDPLGGRHRAQDYRGNDRASAAPNARTASSITTRKAPWRSRNARGTSDGRGSCSKLAIVDRMASGNPHEDGTAALYHRGQRGRRQVHPDRPPALRFQGVYEDQLASVRKATRNQTTGRPGFFAAHRRPARRTRAGNHHRRRLPLLLHARAASSSSPTPPDTSSTRATWPPAPPPPTSPSFWWMPARACCRSRAAMPSSPAARNSAPCSSHQQDGPGGLQRGGFRRHPRRVSGLGRRNSTAGDLQFIPISALQGDNVVHRSARTPWYDGPSLLEHLETVPITNDRNLKDFRFPVQYVIRPEPGLPRLCRPDRFGRDPPRRRRSGAAFRPHQPDPIDRHLRRRTRGSLCPHVGHPVPGGRDRHQPRRHAGAARQPAALRTPPRSQGWCG